MLHNIDISYTLRPAVHLVLFTWSLFHIAQTSSLFSNAIEQDNLEEVPQLKNSSHWFRGSIPAEKTESKYTEVSLAIQFCHTYYDIKSGPI